MISTGLEWLGSEGHRLLEFSTQALGIPFRTLAVAERKKTAQRWLLQHFRPSLGHLFEDNQSVVDKRGRCVLHGQTCDLAEDAEEEEPDISTNGPPCQPFTRARQRSGNTPRTGSTDRHSDFATVMQQWCEYLTCRRPRSWWLEEVGDIDIRIDAKTGRSYLWLLARQCSKLGYTIKAFKFDHFLWVECPRARTAEHNIHHVNLGSQSYPPLVGQM